MYGHTDVQIPPVLQDYISSGSLWSRCPKNRVMDGRTYGGHLEARRGLLEAGWGRLDFG